MNDAMHRRRDALLRLLDGERPISETEAACIRRQIADFETGHERGLIWREDAAEHVCRKFFPMLRFWKGESARKPFILEPWQEHAVIAPLFGWYRETQDGIRRRYRTAYVDISRKNGKTSLAAAIALQGLMADGEPGAKCYSAATMRDQAKLVFDDAYNMVVQSPLAKHVKLWQRSIECPSLKSSLQPLSSDAHSLHGLDVHRAVIDELHQHKTRDVWDVIQTGTPSRRNPLVLGITTAGHDRSGICWEQREYGLSVVNGDFQDDSYFTYITTIDDTDDPFDPRSWHKANPNLGVSVQRDYLEQAAARAQSVAAYENTFRTLHLNQWVSQEVRWLPMAAWDEAKRDYLEKHLAGRYCYGGLDLASTRDITAFVLVFPCRTGYYLLPYFWIPQDSRDERSERDRRMASNWADKGLIKRTHGNVTDYSAVRRDIMRLSEKFRIDGIGYDPHQANETALRLQDDGFQMHRIVQSMASLSDPTREFERLLFGGKLHHDGNPVLRWMASNVAAERDDSGNVRCSKGRSSDKIDGIVAAIMGLRLALTAEPPRTECGLFVV